MAQNPYKQRMKDDPRGGTRALKSELAGAALLLDAAEFSRNPVPCQQKARMHRLIARPRAMTNR